MARIRVSDFCQQFSLTEQDVRSFVTDRLLDRRADDAGLYFLEADVFRLKIILKAQKLGFTAYETKRIMDRFLLGS